MRLFNRYGCCMVLAVRVVHLFYLLRVSVGFGASVVNCEGPKCKKASSSV